MKKTLLLLSFLSFFFIQKVNAQMSNIQSTTYSPAMPLSCNDLTYTMSVQNNCNNFTLTGITHVVNGYVIDVSIDYTVGLICLGALQFIQYNHNLGMLPAGTYTVNTTAYLNGVVQSVNVNTVPVTTCCTAISSFTSDKAFGCVADVDSFTFTNTSTSLTNEWYVNDVLMATTTDFKTPLNTLGTQTVKLVTSDATCSDSTTQTFEIYDNPVLNLGADVNTCLGETELLAAPAAWSDYLWNTGSTSDFIWVTSEDNYYLTVGNSDGCYTTDSVYVTYNVLPTPNIGNDTTICEGETVTLDPGTYNAYAWNPFASTPTLDINLGFNYSVTVTDANGCEGSDTMTLTVINAPAINFLNDTVRICDGETTTFMAPGTYDSYVWSNSETSADIDVDTENNYSLTVTANGCSNTDDIYLKVNPLPIIDLGVDTLQNCEGSGVEIDAGSNFTSYLWNTTETTSAITAYTQGTYSVTVTSDQNCSAMDELFVNVNALPIVSLGEDQDLCKEDKITLDAGSFSSYVWNDASTGSTLEIIGANESLGAKTVSVEVTDENTCVGTDEVVITIKECATAISSVDLENNISINPNPANDFIILNSDKYESFKIEIYSTLGKLVFSVDNLTANQNIDISALNTGIYFMNISVDNERMVKQFVKTK